MTNTSAKPPLIDEHVFLMGRPPMGQFLAFATEHTIDGHKADNKGLSNQWRAANDHIREIEAQEAGIADGAAVREINPSLQPLVEQVLADPIFQRTYVCTPVSLGVVELDRLVVYQKHINLRHVEHLKQFLGDAPDEETIFRLCMPVDHPQPEIRSGRIAKNSYAFYSPSTDMRFLEPVLLNGDQLLNYSPSCPVSGVVGLVVGFGSNYVCALQAENRLVLNNGSHRAYALRDLGITHIPCVIQHISRRDELEIINDEVLENSETYLKAPRPPLLKDYFDPKLRQIFAVQRKMRQVKISFAVESLNVPATQ